MRERKRNLKKYVEEITQPKKHCRRYYAESRKRFVWYKN